MSGAWAEPAATRKADLCSSVARFSILTVTPGLAASKSLTILSKPFVTFGLIAWAWADNALPRANAAAAAANRKQQL